MTTDEILLGILRRLDSLDTTVSKRFDAVDLQIASLVSSIVQPYNPPMVSELWDSLFLSDPLAEYVATTAGWISKDGPLAQYPGDSEMLRLCWQGVEPPTGRILHSGDVVGMSFRRRVAKSYHALDVSNQWNTTAFARANIGPNPAACLVLLNYIHELPNPIDSGSQFGPGPWAQITDLESLYNRLRDISAGTGTYSGA